MLQDDIKAWSVQVDALYKKADSFIKEHPLQKVPSYEDITVRKNLYEAYAAVVVINNDLATLLTDIHRMLMLKTQYKRVVRNEGYGATVVATFNKFIDEVGDTVSLVDKMLNVYKVGVDSQLRFYQSVQYILGSPRLNAYD